MIRRLREAWAARQLTETLAWSCLATNLLVLPGLGSMAARRYVSGAAQALLALAGTGLTISWLVSFARIWMAEGSFPLDGGEDFGLGLLGVGLFAMAWLWSLATSLMIVRAARIDPRPPGGVTSDIRLPERPSDD